MIRQRGGGGGVGRDGKSTELSLVTRYREATLTRKEGRETAGGGHDEEGVWPVTCRQVLLPSPLPPPSEPPPTGCPWCIRAGASSRGGVSFLPLIQPAFYHLADACFTNEWLIRNFSPLCPPHCFSCARMPEV